VDFINSFLMLDAGRWTLDAGRWTLKKVVFVQDIGQVFFILFSATDYS
jgi:hypothetical protein